MQLNGDKVLRRLASRLLELDVAHCRNHRLAAEAQRRLKLLRVGRHHVQEKHHVARTQDMRLGESNSRFCRLVQLNGQQKDARGVAQALG